MQFQTSAPQSLKHLPFFEVLASAPEDSLDARLATAGLLSLRMLDHWVLAGPAIVEPESVSVRSVRRAIMALPANEPAREALLTTVNTMQMLRQVDLVPVLPRVFAYAQLLERHYGVMALAADGYESVIRLADLEFDAELVMDSYYRLAFCQRKTGALDLAAKASTTLSRIAGRRKDRARVLRGKMGLGQVAMMRGELAEADTQFSAIAAEAEKHELTREYAMALHNRAVVASRNHDPVRASVLAHSAMKLTADPVERDRVLSDLAAFLISAGRYDAALDALRVLEVTASSNEQRLTVGVNIVIAAARAGNRELFDRTRSALAYDTIPIEARLNLLVEVASGLERFGNFAESRTTMSEATQLADTHGVPLPEATELTAATTTTKSKDTRGTQPELDPARAIAMDLHQMAAAIAT